MLYKIALLTHLILSTLARPDYKTVFNVNAKDFDLVNTPVCVDLNTTQLNEKAAICLQFKGGNVPAQIEKTDGRLRLWWIVNLKAGESMKYKLRISNKCQTESFSWNRVSKYSLRLVRGNQPVIQYEYPVFDSNDILATHKPYHHVFDPAGDQLITKGPGGLEPHHKGIFYGFRNITVGDKKVNVWAAFDGERTEHAETLNEFAGPVMAGHTLKILWKDKDGIIFAEELRTLRVFGQPVGESLIDFHSVLRASAGPVKLEGDRQHAGVQFRAAQYVADNLTNTTFIRPSDRSQVKPDIEIDSDAMRNMPWDAMNFKIGDRQYTVAYLTHPSKPAFAEMSERRYGRFGEYFPHLLTKESPLEVNYRFWVKAGDKPSVESVDLRYKAFAEPPPVVIK